MDSGKRSAGVLARSLGYNQFMLQRYQWIIFWLVCAAIAFVLAVRIWVLMPLYTDPALRSRTQTLIQATAKREGWLLSGVSISAIDTEKIQLRYQSYLRGEDPISCYNISFSTGLLSTCEDF